MRTHKGSSVSPDTSIGTQWKVSGGFLSLSFSRIHFIETEMRPKARIVLRNAFPAKYKGTIAKVYLLHVPTKEFQEAYKWEALFLYAC